jgi:hypothetical protein
MTVVRSQTRTVVVPKPPAGSPGAPGAPGGNVMSVGLFIALAAMSVAAGTAIIQTAGHTTSGKGYATYVEDTSLNDAAVAAFPNARVKTSNGRYFRLSHEQMLNPLQFGCPDSNDGTLRDAGPELAAMDDYLHEVAINPSAGNFYRGAPPVFWGNNHFHDEATPLEPKSTICWFGCGSARWGASGGAGTLLTFGHNCPGPRPQAFNTTGITGTTADHDASASFIAKHMRWSGGYNGTGVADEAEIHGFNPRCPYQLEDIFIENFQGTGFLAEAGTVIRLGATNIGGNVSTARAIGVKVANCRDGFIVGGGDGNLMRFYNPEAYQNRRYGVRSENGAGSNLWDGLHCASNGMISGIGSYTQTSTGGYRYGLAEGGNPLVAPSGSPTDTVNWLYIEPGAAIPNLIPAYVATPGLFRNGGDMVTAGSDGSQFLESYSEYGTLNQFAAGTIINGGTIGLQYFRGGNRLTSNSSGLTLVPHLGGNLNLLPRNGEAGLWILDMAGSPAGYLDFGVAFGWQMKMGAGGFLLRNASGIVSSFDNNGYYSINSNQVLGARGAGVTRISRTATSGSLPTPDGSITIANAATPTVVELLEYCTEIEAKLEELTSRFRAATGHGAIA